MYLVLPSLIAEDKRELLYLNRNLKTSRIVMMVRDEILVFLRRYYTEVQLFFIVSESST
jgi:hypothetical protein